MLKWRNSILIKKIILNLKAIRINSKLI